MKYFITKYRGEYTIHEDYAKNIPHQAEVAELTDEEANDILGHIDSILLAANHNVFTVSPSGVLKRESTDLVIGAEQ